MSGIQSFNDMLKMFVQELAEVFPENKDLAGFASSLDDVISLNARMPMTIFMDAVGPHAKYVSTRDPTLFDVMKFPGVDFKTMWHSDISDSTKDAIWQYMNTLLLFGTTVSTIPENVLSDIESLAAEYAQKIQDGSMSMPQMMTEVMGKMQTMDLSALQNVDLGALTASLGIDAGALMNGNGLAALGMDPSMLAGLMGGMGGGGMGDMSALMSMLGNGTDDTDVLALLEAAKPESKKSSKKSTKKSSKK